MPAYLIVQSTTTNPAQVQQYRDAVIPHIASHGGRLLVRGPKIEVLEGHHDGCGLARGGCPEIRDQGAPWAASRTSSHVALVLVHQAPTSRVGSSPIDDRIRCPVRKTTKAPNCRSRRAAGSALCLHPFHVKAIRWLNPIRHSRYSRAR